MVRDQEIAIGRVRIPAKPRAAKGPGGQAGDHRAQRLTAVTETFGRRLERRVVVGGKRKGDGYFLFGIVGVGNRNGIEVAVSVAGDFQEAVLGRDDEEASAHVEEDGHLFEACLLCGCEVYVG